MIISSKKIMSVTEASQNFNNVTQNANKYGEIIIFKRNKPAYILLDIERMGDEFIKEYEKLKLKFVSESIIEEYEGAYKELSK